MIRAVNLALVLAACDGAFDLEHVSYQAPDAPVATACVDSESPIRDRFDGNPPCAPWAMPELRDATIRNANSALEIEVTAIEGYAICTDELERPIPDNGIFAEVPAVGGEAWFGFSYGGAVLLIYAGAGAFTLSRTGENFAAVPYEPEAMRWWRLRADRAANRFVAEYSPDSMTWSYLGATDVYPTDASVRLTVGAGLGAAQPPQANRFAGINVCD